MNEPQQSEENPYLATQVSDIATYGTDRKRPGTVAVVFSVILGFVAAVIAFGAGFFFTCLGVYSIDGLDNEFGLVIMFLVAGLTSVAAFIFTVRGFQKIVQALRN